MDRRRILLVSAVLVAALGTVLVLLYARGADARAEERFETARVLQATALIEAGEPIADALAAGKVAPVDVAVGSRLPSAVVDSSALAGASVALTAIYPGEQIIAEKLGDAAATGPQLLIPDTGELAISVNLTDPARVAGFVTPGSEVSVFVTTSSYSRVLLTRVRVLGVGSTTPVSTATTDETGQETVEQLPRTLVTLSLTQKQAEKVLYAQSIGELAVALLTDQSDVEPGPATGAGSLFR
ncbi:Flp pilus assembly protein CpaB [Nocardioides lianchengensis]|uniref:Pilus assembly protein CpaB n=1 Tax=Nocardioides lianchengensis TaxID=1045774 RepID=A0A1G6MVQ7_9ACTN|nr:Flp pilus assembly protein CpaB [Nocardioides lianchengensis]NYG10553.1 pilus assembly protein CpaB [Nocardioides lianchengensis]SDC59314.1 pilus assembly protein CpaB [Nocardioides lianchengensis]